MTNLRILRGRTAAGHAVVAGSTAATAIDLTDDDQVPTSPSLNLLHGASPPAITPQLPIFQLRPLCQSLSSPETRLTPPDYRPPAVLPRKGNTQNRLGSELEILNGHRSLSFWKDKYFQELKLDQEHKLVIRAASLFEQASIQTLVPNRYLRPLQKEKGRSRPNFPGVIEILGAGQAVKKAYEEHTTSRQDASRLVLWSDASKSKNGHGLAVAWRQSRPQNGGWDEWSVAGYKAIGQLVDSSILECLAVIKALDKACELIKRKIPGNELADKIAGISGLHTYGDLVEVVDLTDEDYDEERA